MKCYIEHSSLIKHFQSTTTENKHKLSIEGKLIIEFSTGAIQVIIILVQYYMYIVIVCVYSCDFELQRKCTFEGLSNDMFYKKPTIQKEQLLGLLDTCIYTCTYI